MEHNLMTVKDVAEYMRLSEQTIQRYVLNKEIPFHKVKKVIRFRLSEIEKWIDKGGGACRNVPSDGREGDLFAGIDNLSAEDNDNGKAGETGAADNDTREAEPDGTGEVKA
ncbi:MAG: helix-turn-helix domain-containing protein [Treponema sp.]|jgi:excisionase family DNA binding protein|nr:helix-turn-helix domain-containing protein [Treponema sp.]